MILSPFSENITADGSNNLVSSNPAGGDGDLSSSVAFKSFVFEASTDDTTISIVVERHPDLDMNFAGSAVATVTASDGFNSAGRYTPLSENVSWSVGDVSSKTVYLTVPAQTLDGPFEANLDLTPVSGCSVRKWEEGAALARVDDGSVYSLAYHVSPDDPNARDETDAGTVGKPALSGYYLLRNIVRPHPDVTKPVMIYFHTGSYTDSGSAPPYSSKFGYYPEIDGTREHPIKIQNYPGDTVSLANSIGFLLEDRQHVHLKGFDTGTHSNYITHWVQPTANYIIVEDFTVAGFRAASGSENFAGVRIDFAGNTVIRNCDISDYKQDNGDYNHNLSPIISYRSYNVLVEHCDFDDAAAGIYMKLPPSQDTAGEQGWTIRRNKFGSLLVAKVLYTNNVVSLGYFDSTLLYQNLMLGGVGGVDRISESNDLVQDEGIVASVLPLHFYNNTVVDCGNYDWSGQLVNHYNNAFRSTATRMIKNLSDVNRIEADGSIINFSDFNLSNIISGTILSTGPVTEDYATKAAWNAATAGTRLLTANPDSNSFLEAATFANEGAGDYTITNANAAGNGLGGLDIGATSNVGIV